MFGCLDAWSSAHGWLPAPSKKPTQTQNPAPASGERSNAHLHAAPGSAHLGQYLNYLNYLDYLTTNPNLQSIKLCSFIYRQTFYPKCNCRLDFPSIWLNDFTSRLVTMTRLEGLPTRTSSTTTSSSTDTVKGSPRGSSRRGPPMHVRTDGKSR